MKKFAWIFGAIVVFYGLTHLFNLTALPVFADEAIYVRWAQLIMDEPLRYALFPLNDGKTPLFVWSMIPFQYLFADQLFAARLVSVIVGLLQVLAIGWVVRLLGGKKTTVALAMIMTSVLPFWFFHHRMALMDGMMTMWLTFALGGVLRITHTQIEYGKKDQFTLNKRDVLWIILTGAFFGFALLSKLPAVLFVPILGLGVFLIPKINPRRWFWSSVKVGIALGFGFVMFVLLKLHPAFGQLFGRGSDFLFPLSDVLAGAWRQTLPSVPNYVWYFMNYLTLPAVIMVLAGLFSPQKKLVHHVLLWQALLFFMPIAIMGRVVYPRYLLPVSIFLTISAVLAFENYYLYYEKSKNLLKKYIAQIILVILLANMLGSSGAFMYYSLFSPDETPFVKADKVQYLYEWSSGHGIKQTVELIENMAQDEKVAVATEGYFGTLPDAILMYLHGRDVTNISINGIGQPIRQVPEEWWEIAKPYDRKLLVVNSHRLEIDYNNDLLLAEFCRPDNSPCLQVWDITNSQE